MYGGESRCTEEEAVVRKKKLLYGGGNCFTKEKVVVEKRKLLYER